MEKQFPKNVRQIGNVSDSPKIYVEDYVDTFFNQICEGDAGKPSGAFLIGNQVTVEEQPCVYISGAVQVEELPMQDGNPVINEEILEKAKAEKEKYFHDGEFIGWFLNIPGQKAETNENIIKIHEKTFPNTNTVFIIHDADAKEEMFFAYKYHDLLQIGGHYIYYEKNPDMQNYMITKRRQNGVTPSETVTDQAAKSFRSAVREQMVQSAKKHKKYQLPSASATLILLVVVFLGVSVFNNIDKLKAVQRSFAMLSQAVAASGEAAAGDKMKAEIKWEDEKKEPVQGQAVAEVQEQAPEDAEVQSSTILQEEAVEASAGEEALLTEDDFYVVRKGETLDSISKKIYGDISYVDAICRMNGLKDGNLIFIGQKILLP